jgi:hypothetical protein
VNRVEEWTTEIRERRDRDQALRVQWQSDIENPDFANKVAETDCDNSRWLSEVLSDLGQWPRLSEFGEYVVFSCWLLAQHADPELQDACLEMMLATPPEERIGANLAYLIDRVTMRKQGFQIYGTQVEMVDGITQVLPVKDPQELDERRASVGLENIAKYLKLF